MLTASEEVHLLRSPSQTGEGYTLQSLGPVPGARRLALPESGAHVLALTETGDLKAWGDNSSGQLGVGTLKPQAGFVTVPLSGVTAIAAGAAHSVALKTDGTVWSWGANAHGQLGNGTLEPSSSPNPTPGLWDITAIAAGSNFTLALRSDGTVWLSGGSAERTSAVQLAELRNIAAITVRSDVGYALGEDGRIHAIRGAATTLLGEGAEPLLTAELARRFSPNARGLRDAEWIGGAPGRKIRIANHSVEVEENGNVSAHPIVGALYDVEVGWAVGLITDPLASGRASGAKDETKSSSEPGGESRSAVGVAPTLTGTDRLSSSHLSVDAHDRYSLTLSGGRLCSFGENVYGQLGDGTSVTRNRPMAAALSGIAEVAAGERHVVARKTDGTVWAWGYNGYGQLGRDLYSRPTPFQVPGLSNIISVAAGRYHSVALRNDGVIFTFGYNGYGQLGNGTTVDSSTPVQVINLTGVTAVEAGGDFTIARKSDGTVWGWGYNSSGQLGDGTTTSRSSPVRVTDLTGVTAIAAGINHALALKNDGSAWAWGSNGYGQLGNGNTSNATTPVRSGTLTGVTSIAAGYRHSAVVKSDGTVWTWGWNADGQLGDGTTTNRTTPVQVTGLSGAAGVAAGYYHTLVVKTDGSFWAWGYNGDGQLGTGANANSSVPVAVEACAADPTPPATQLRSNPLLSAGEEFSQAVRGSDGAALGWGKNSHGQIGDGSTTIRNAPTAATGVSGMIGISGYAYHAVAVGSNGAVRAWGNNSYGQLGDGTTTNRLTPVTVSGLANIVQVATGVDHTIYLRADGVVFASGRNNEGQLGNGTVVHSATPVQVINLSGVTAIAAGAYSSMARKSDGTVWTWGYNGSGQLGDGTRTGRTSPVQVTGLSTVTSIAAGAYHALALKSDGTVWSWGSNNEGRLGDGTTSRREYIVRVSGLTGVTAIAAGVEHSLALKSDGTIWGFGKNSEGQLGNGSTANSAVPVQTLGGPTGTIAIAAGMYHSLARTASGSIWAWGFNGAGQFGLASPTISTVPIQGPDVGVYVEPKPVIQTLSPSSVTAGAAAFTLTVTGQYFSPQSVVRWNGANRTTTFVNSTSLTAQISAGDVASQGTATVTVNDSAGLSDGKLFTISAPISAPGTPQSPSPADQATAQALTVNLTWTATGATSYDVYLGVTNSPGLLGNTSSASYNPGGLAANTTYYWRIVAKNAGGSTSGPVWRFTTGSGGSGNPSTGLRFIPITPCRLVDTRAGQGFTGAFGAPTPGGGSVREIPVPSGGCNIPSGASAYSVNVTVVPHEPLGYLSLWPTGQSQPMVSTLNSFHGGVVANAAIVPAGTGGAISFYVTNQADVILDINGYFDSTTASAYSFYTVNPCRLADTRAGSGFTGVFGSPSPTAGSTRSLPLPGKCSLPQANAYSLNFTVLPHEPLAYLSAWGTGQSQPLVSTLNSFDATVVANAALVPAGTGGAISTFVTNPTDLIVDVNGYFGASGSPNDLRFYPVTPCRLADTRLTGQGAPVLSAGASRSFTVAGKCEIPSDAKAYAMNVTVVPSEPLGFVTLWPTGSGQPVVSTLNSFLGRIVANAAIVPAGTGGTVSAFASNETHLILDINGYFR